MILIITQISKENHASRVVKIVNHASLTPHAANLGPITHYADNLGLPSRVTENPFATLIEQRWWGQSLNRTKYLDMCCYVLFKKRAGVYYQI